MSSICVIDNLETGHIIPDEPCTEYWWDLPQVINIHENEYIDKMPIDPEIKEYINKIIGKKIEKLKKQLILTTEESLIRLWDNEDDDIWNDF